MIDTVHHHGSQRNGRVGGNINPPKRFYFRSCTLWTDPLQLYDALIQPQRSVTRLIMHHPRQFYQYCVQICTYVQIYTIYTYVIRTWHGAKYINIYRFVSKRKKESLAVMLHLDCHIGFQRFFFSFFYVCYVCGRCNWKIESNSANSINRKENCVILNL